MNITFHDFARALGNARLDFYRFYAPSWSEPPALDELRRELAHGYRSERRSVPAPVPPRLVPSPARSVEVRHLPRAA